MAPRDPLGPSLTRTTVVLTANTLSVYHNQRPIFLSVFANCLSPTLLLIYSTIALESPFRRDLVALRANQ